MKSVTTNSTDDHPQTSNARFQPIAGTSQPYTTIRVANILVATAEQSAAWVNSPKMLPGTGQEYG